MQLFAYGTLRPGGALHHNVVDALRAEPIPAYVKHYELRHLPHRSYPVMCWSDDARVYGDILDLDPRHPATADMILMELSAGYDVVHGIALPRNNGQHPAADAYEHPFNVLMCIADTSTTDLPDDTCPIIPGGDWLAVADPAATRGFVTRTTNPTT